MPVRSLHLAAAAPGQGLGIESRVAPRVSCELAAACVLDGTGLGIALFSYDGKLHVGLNAEYDLVPDLSAFTALFAQSFMAIADATRVEAERRPLEALSVA